VEELDKDGAILDEDLLDEDGAVLEEELEEDDADLEEELEEDDAVLEEEDGAILDEELDEDGAILDEELDEDGTALEEELDEDGTDLDDCADLLVANWPLISRTIGSFFLTGMLSASFRETDGAFLSSMRSLSRSDLRTVRSNCISSGGSRGAS